MRKPFIVVLTLLLAVSATVAADKITTVPRPTGLPSFLGYVPDRLIVVMQPDAGKLNMQMAPNAVVHIGEPDFDKISDRFAVSSIVKQFPGSEPGSLSKTGELAKYYKIEIETGTLEEAMAAYSSHPMVEHVEPIGIHAMYATPNDNYYSYQWHHNQTSDHDIDSPEAWDIETGSTSTIIAILDSGTRYYHPDLGGVNASVSNPGASRGNMWINTAELNGSASVDDDGNGYVDDWIGYDFIASTTSCWSGEDCSTKDNDPRDFNGHGTHTSGIFGMITNDGYGMCGVAGGWGSGSQAEYGNGVKIMPLRMGYSYNYLGQEYGVVLMDAAAEAFYYAADNGAKVASCSWGSSNTGGIGTAATYFLNAGGIICVAAGNDGAEVSPDYLNGRGDCISVAATNESDNGASFTTYGTWVDICAPGNNIYSTYHDHTAPSTIYWASMSGTSMATPMTAGVCGLIWSQNPSWTAAQVTSQLYSTADDIDAYLSSKYIGKMGAGRINSFNAVNTVCYPPVANFSGTPLTGNAPLTVQFTDLSTNSPTSWLWNFGDLGTSTLKNPSHVYNDTGHFTVTLTATNACGSDQEVKVSYVTVTAAPPQQCDDFADGNISNWVNKLGTWTATGGYMKGNSTTSNARTTSPFGSFGATSINCDIRMNTGRSNRIARIIFAWQNGSNYRFAQFDDKANTVRIYGRVNGSNSLKASASVTMSSGVWYNVTVNIESGGNVSIVNNGNTLLSYNFGNVITGPVGVGYDVSNTDFDDFCVGAPAGAIADQEENVVAKVQELPEGFALRQNFPNPFNPTTEIAFTLPTASHVTLEIYNVLGQRVVTLVDDYREAGEHVVQWNSTDAGSNRVSSGIYFYRLQAGEFAQTKKMVLLK